MGKDNLWDDDSGFDSREMQPPCGGVRFEPEEITDSKGSFDWGLAISTFLLIGMISIIGHLINMWRN